MENKKKSKKIIILSILVIVVILLVIGLVVSKSFVKSNKLTSYVDSTSIEKISGYRMDLRIYGTYNNKSINKIIMVNNYKDTNKDITISSGDNEEHYIIKDNKKYKVEDDKLVSVSDVSYSNTDIYLKGINSIKNIKESKDEKIGDNTYKVYTGVIKASSMSDILKESLLDIKLNSDIEAEVWVTSDNYVYKVYYKLDNLTIYASYFGYDTINKIDLSMYKID